MNCDFKSFSPINCNQVYRHFDGQYELHKCLIDTKKHLTPLIKQPNTETIYEYDLIMMRAGVYPDINKFKFFKICAAHRSVLGLGFLNKSSCEHPFHKNQSKLTTTYRKVNYSTAYQILQLRKICPESQYPLVILGSMLCSTCYTIVQTSLNNTEAIEHKNRFEVLKDMFDFSIVEQSMFIDIF